MSSDEREFWPLNDREKALWLLHRMIPQQGVVNIPFSFRVPDYVEISALRQAARWVVQRHPALSVQILNDQPIRVRRDIAQVDASIEVLESSSARLDDDMQAAAMRPFDLERDLLVRFTMFDLSDGNRELLVVVHHLVFDALSVPVFVNDLTAAHDSFARAGLPPAGSPASGGVAPSLPETPESLRYWKDRILGLRPGAMMLDAADYSNPEASFVGGHYLRTLSPSTAKAIRELRRGTHATDNVVLLAAYLLLLHRHGAGNDLVTGVPIDLRPADQQDLVGYHISTLPLRVQLTADDSFSSFANRTLETFFEAFEHREVSYEAVARRFVQHGHDWQAPLFRHMFNFVPKRPSIATAESWVTEVDRVDTGYVRFDLEMLISVRGDDYRIQLSYRSDLHDEAFISRFCDRYEALLCSAAADLECPIGQLSIATGHDAVITLANRTAVQWPAPRTTAGMVAQQIRTRPQNVAMNAPQGIITYEELHRMTARAAERLTEAGVQAGGLVAVATGRGPVSAAAALAAWRVGAAYMPMDLAYPLEHLRFQLRDAAADAIVASAETARRVGESITAVVEADELLLDPQEVGGSPSSDLISVPEWEPEPEDMAYLIYTPSSTDKPKGVQITHADMANVLRHFSRALNFNSSKAMAWMTTFASDNSALELFLPLSQGGRVVVVSDEARRDARKLVNLVDVYSVDMLQATPTTWRMVAELDDVNLSGRWVLCGGEPLTAPLARRMLVTGARLMNVYSASETTVCCTMEIVDGPSMRGRPVVGVPIANTTIAVRDEHGRACPVDIIGELVITGAGVGAEYPRTTNVSDGGFLHCGRADRSSRTGDLGLWRSDGRLELHGRADRQVKIGGQRLELDRVEAVLEEHPGVVAAGVVMCGPVDDEQVLTAFVLPRAGVSAEDLWDFAALRLPGYAVPGSIRLAERLPVSGSGKIDYLRLSELAAEKQPAGPAQRRPSAPVDDVTTWLVEVWRQLLGEPALHPDSSFFLSGGQSIVAVQVALEIKERYDIDLPLMAIFTNPTPRSLGAALYGYISAAGRSDEHIS